MIEHYFIFTEVRNNIIKTIMSKYDRYNRYGKKYNKYQIPEGWLDYSKMGEIIENSNIIAMRVPLKAEFSELEEREKFSVQNAIDMVEQKDRQVGMVINLCFTDKYYDVMDFKSKGAPVEKIMVPGQTVPEEKYIRMFCDAIVEFERNNKDSNKIVLVHCTHGLNRTGFLICSYLIRVKGITPAEAVKSFEEARGHKIKRQYYVDALLAMKPTN